MLGAALVAIGFVLQLIMLFWTIRLRAQSMRIRAEAQRFLDQCEQRNRTMQAALDKQRAALENAIKKLGIDAELTS